MAGPLVSVVVTSFNRAEFLEDAVRSVMNQTYQDLEILVSDDGSTDGSQDIILALSREDSRIIPILAKVNQGMSANLNGVLDRFRGEHLGGLPHDDLMLPTKIERQLEFMQRHPECGILTHDLEVFDSDTGKTIHYYRGGNGKESDGVEILFKTDWFLQGFHDTRALGSAFYRGAFARSSRFDWRLKYHNEFLYPADCMMRTGLRWCHLPEVLERYRMHDSNLHKSEGFHENYEEELFLMWGIMAARYPELAPLIRNKRLHRIFMLALHHAPAEKRPLFEKMLRTEGGLPLWLYLQAVRTIGNNQSLLERTRPVRHLMKKGMRMARGMRRGFAGLTE